MKLHCNHFDFFPQLLILCQSLINIYISFTELALMADTREEVVLLFNEAKNADKDERVQFYAQAIELVLSIFLSLHSKI